jgi:polysaccharide biosynthesis/export protein
VLTLRIILKRPQRHCQDVLGPDDQIVVPVAEGPDLGDKPLLIGTNGNITLPLVGRVQAAGRPVEQLEATIEMKLMPYVKKPQVSVTVTEFRSQPVSVLGAVTSPGIIQLRGQKKLYEVLSLAGGPRDSSGATISIVRPAENGPLPLPGATQDFSGRYSRAEVNVQELLADNDPAVNIEIKPHDIISVSEGNNRMVYVVGDVQRAGAFNLGSRATVSVLSALAQAGGLGHTARPERAIILRATARDNTDQRFAVNLRLVLMGRAEDVALRPGDILVVPTSSRKVFNTVVTGTLAGVVSSVIYAGVARSLIRV